MITLRLSRGSLGSSMFFSSSFQAVDLRLQLEDLGFRQHAHLIIVAFQQSCAASSIWSSAWWYWRAFSTSGFQVDALFVQLGGALVVIADFHAAAG